MRATPPRAARWLLAIALPSGLRGDTIRGDLAEEFHYRAAQSSPARAGAWYWRAALTVSIGVGVDRWRRRHMAAPPPRSRVSMMDRLLQDLQPAIRLLWKQPAFTLAAMITIALGIGANTAVFTVAWHLLLRPLPYPHGNRLVELWETVLPQGGTNTVMPANYRAWARDTQSFDAVAAYTYFTTPVDLTGGGDPEQLRVRYVTADYFKVFETAPLAGRTLDERDVTPDAATLVLSEGVWRRRFGGDPGLIGRTIQLAGQPQTVVGVMPDSFGTSAGRMDAWAGHHLAPENGPRLAAHYLGVVARLKPSTTIDQAIADVKNVAARDAAQFPETNKDRSATVRSMDTARGERVRDGLVVMAGAAGVVLLIACANLASLQLARGLARGREFGLRAALGASRRRLMWQLTIEGLVLAAGGTVIGLVLSQWLLGALAGVAPPDVARAARGGLDGTVLGFTVIVTGLVALLSATAPSWRAATRATSWLGQRAATADRATARARTALVIGQIALAIMLLVAATLLVSSLARVLRVEPGFDPRGVLAFDVSLPPARYETFSARERLLDRLADALTALPGVTATCVTNDPPFDNGGSMTYVPDGRTTPISALPRNVTPGCFEVLRVALVRGRLFTSHETARVGIVTERFARRAWPDADPIGRRVHLGVPTGDLIEIVGVVADSRQVSLEYPGQPQFYEVASEASAFWGSKMLVRTSVAPASLFARVRAAVRGVDADQPVARLRLLEDTVGASVSDRRFDLILIVSFVAIAVVLSAVGIYGLLGHLVAQRTREIGIRMAVGATATSVSRLIMAHAWLTVGVGVPLGLLGAWLASRLVRPLLFGIVATELWVYAAAAVSLAMVALLAAWLPARRAARIDPLTVLRQ